MFGTGSYLRNLAMGLAQAFLMSSVAVAAAPLPAGPVTVTPDFIRQQVLSSNISLEQELGIVKEQKDNMDIKRDQLIPSLNIGANIASGPSFLISQIQFLLPFLIPANWFALDAATDQFNAEEVSYKILELNVLSSSLAMFYIIQSDYQMSAVYSQEAKDLMDVYQIKKTQSDLLGTVPPEQLEQALASAQLAQVTASQLLELALVESNMFRQVLNLPLNTVMVFPPNDMAPSDWEGQPGKPTPPVQAAVDNAKKVAPEAQQLGFLLSAAKAGVLNANFGFINSATLSAQGSGGQNSSFGSMTGGLNFHFGLDIFPTISLNQQKVNDVQLQQMVLESTLTQTVSSATDSLNQASYQFATAKSAELGLTDVYSILQQKYDLGLIDYLSVLTAHQQLVSASVARIKAEQDLNQQRVNLHRVMLTDQFGLVKGCQATAVKSGGGFLGGIFKRKPAQKALVDICIEGGSKQ